MFGEPPTKLLCGYNRGLSYLYAIFFNIRSN